ncbi:protein-methionine sulfoxide oxidase mical2b [Anoplopoma fimbria]|uniref:protein-methionine sulfoxide oxidase mical2b n=1 Tax=Anoplopoma fimbria TaxID=229290 RepID=UPI0023EAD18C|nr:protein-methionine sulfoxide oxidase mical2b [Anoplopoma fimbria]
MSAVKALQQWCRVRCDGYRDVSITNMTTSFRDGMAFCALIHKHRPDLINFDSLKKEDVYENNKLAFKVAEEELGIPALLDAEDMVALRVPDRLSILTYVSQYYNYFHGRSPIGGLGGIKRPADNPTEEPSGKKNQPVAAKVFPSSKPARENSPPPSSNITRPSPSPKQTRNATKDAVVDRSHQTGTLSNKCASCNFHVHLVQRHLVDGKLYHRSCAKALSPTNPTALFRGLPTNTPVSRLTPLADATKTNTVTPTHTPSRLGPSWLTEKPSTPPTFSTTLSSNSSPSRPASSLSPAAKESPTCVVSKPAASRTPSASPVTTATTSINTMPVAAPRTSITAAKTTQSKFKFFKSESDEEKKKTTTTSIVINKGPNATDKVKEATAGQAVSLVVNVGGFGKKEANVSPNAGGDSKAKARGEGGDSKAKTAGEGGDSKAKAAGGGGDSKAKAGDSKAKAAGEAGDSKAKASAAAFISKKLTEENNNNNTAKPAWTTVALKKTDKPAPQVETPKRETEGVRGRKVLKADRSILDDLPTRTDTRTPSPAGGSGLRARTPDRGAPKPGGASPNTSALENKDSPSDWRSKLKPIAKPAGPSEASPKPWANGAGKPQTSDLSVGPSPSSHLSSLSISVTPPAEKGFLNGQKDPTENGTKSESKKLKPGYILKEDIMRELQEIEDNLNEWEKRGVELEVKLRSSEHEGEDDSLMDVFMIEWFNLIRNKQVAMRRESELVYIGKTQDLEEEQPTVEQELRRLMDKPDRLKTSWDRKREEQLMAKLVEIVNDRNAIIEGLDEDRLREEEEDEELDKMMMSFNIKKDKPKKKSPMSKLFSWGNKKEG